jgi:hypothetical protein
MKSAGSLISECGDLSPLFTASRIQKALTSQRTSNQGTKHEAFHKLILIALGLYLLVLAGFWLDASSSGQFAKTVSHVPEPLFAILP